MENFDYNKLQGNSSIKIVAWLKYKYGISPITAKRIDRTVEYFFEPTKEYYAGVQEYQQQADLKSYLHELDVTRKQLSSID